MNPSVRLCRLLTLIRMLQSGRAYSPNELAQELEVSRRTVFRDLVVLRMAHIPYYYDRQRRGYKIRSYFRFPLPDEGRGTGQGKRAESPVVC